MKSFIIIFILIVSTECGLLDDLVSSTDLKAKTGKESNRAESHQGVLLKVHETLKNGTKIVIDALGNVIHVNPKEKKENDNSKGSLDSPKGTEEVIKKEETSKPDVKADIPTSTEKVKVEAPKVEETENKTLSTTTEVNAETKDAAKNETNTTPTSKPDVNSGKNCTSTDDKDCGSMKLTTRAFFKGDECPAGKNRADDGTCVDEV